MREYLKTLGILSFIVAIFVGGEKLFTHLPQGLWVSLVTGLTTVLAIRSIVTDMKPSPSRRIFLTGLILLGVANASFAIRYYFLGLSDKSIYSVLLTSICYALMYFTFFLGILVNNRIGRRIVLKPAVICALLLTIPILVKFLIPTYIDVIAKHGLTPFHMGRVINSASSFLLGNLALLLLLTTRNIFWTFYALGAFTFIVVNWTWSVEVLLARNYDFGFYGYFYEVGSVLMGLTFIRHSNAMGAAFENEESLSGHSRLIVFSVVALILLVEVTLLEVNFWTPRLIASFLFIDAVGAILISEALVSRISDSSIKMGKLVKNGLVGDELQNELAKIPLEIRHNFNHLFAQELRSERVRRELDTKIRKVSQQVAHDIKSPLAALNLITANTKTIPEDKRLILRTVSKRITDIANNLSTTNDSPSTHSRTFMLSSILSEIVSEKRTQFLNHPNIEIEFLEDRSSYGIYLHVCLVDFKRVLSNLIDNAVESIAPQSGRVSITLKRKYAQIVLSIQDTGRGFPEEVIKNLGKEGLTRGKPQGHGLGLSHAVRTVKKWQGHLEVASLSKKGSRVDLLLPPAPVPSWFLPSLDLSQIKKIGIVDDDESIHKIWKHRLENFFDASQISHFYSPREFSKWIEGRATKNELYLIDYEFATHPHSGLETISKIGIEKSAVLVTSHFDDLHVVEECEKKSIPLLPKNMASFVPIHSNH